MHLSPRPPGLRLRAAITGSVVDQRGRPVEGAAVVAYNTDRTGVYDAPGAGRVARISATLVTDAAGRFQALTIHPSAYPGGSDPAHVHFHTTAAGYTLKYTTIWIEGDPLITPARRAEAARSDETVIVPLEPVEGLDRVRVVIRLSEN